MRRRGMLLPVLALGAMVALGACSTQERRPEGVVERWLQALDQGTTGRPGLYGDAAASDAALPDHAQREPGSMDLIEVGAATDAGVPFRFVLVSGDEVRGTAILRVEDGVLRVATVDRDVAEGLPSEGGARPGESGYGAYLIALAVAAAFIALAAGLIGAVRRSSSV